MGRPTVAARSVAFAALGPGILALVGCTRVLGIDGSYVLASESEGGSPGVASGTSGSGGAQADASMGAAGGSDEAGSQNGASGAGGASSGGAAGVVAVGDAGPADTGCRDCAPPPPLGPCTPGAYTGTQSGMHAPTVTFVGIPLPVDGTVKFRLEEADAGASTIANGDVEGHITLSKSMPPVTAPFHATLAGSVDCETGQLSGVLDGKFWFTSDTTVAPAGTFHGAYQGKFSSKEFSGTWNEQEPNAVPPQSPLDTGKGQGTWSAARTGP